MYDQEIIEELVAFISEKDGILDKSSLAVEVEQRFHLTKSRSVFYRKEFAIRFCTAKNAHFSNTVLSLSALRKYDRMPFIVCLVTPQKNYLMLANTTFLRKISHSSQSLREDNIKGSFNGSDIMYSFEGVENSPNHFEFLFTSHENYSFEENLRRLVEATNNITPIGQKFMPTEKEVACIYQSIDRAISFLSSKEYDILNQDLLQRVEAVKSKIALAAEIDNVNLRGRVIEYLITAKDDLKKTLIQCLQTKKPLPKIFTKDELGDYEREVGEYLVATDIKTKILYLSSNPKGYNIDKMLKFHGKEKSVYLIYVVAIDQNQKINTCLCSMYSKQLLEGTRIIKHWAGRNSRGVTQYDGRCLEKLITAFDLEIDKVAAHRFLESCLEDDICQF